jgi:hypothetical protein
LWIARPPQILRRVFAERQNRRRNIKCQSRRFTQHPAASSCPSSAGGGTIQSSCLEVIQLRVRMVRLPLHSKRELFLLHDGRRKHAALCVLGVLWMLRHLPLLLQPPPAACALLLMLHLLLHAADAACSISKTAVGTLMLGHAESGETAVKSSSFFRPRRNDGEALERV